jgi:formiminotetrahydrofolate cyclodeaminase
MHDASATLDAFLAAAAARQPTPGGGSVSALTGALAASMGEMVLNYSIPKKELQAHRPLLEAAVAELTRARRLLLGLMVEDQAAYGALSAARKESPAAFEAALASAIAVPQSIAATALAILHICSPLVDKVNRLLLSDLAVCGDLAMATLRCASHNIRANLSDIADPARRQMVDRETAQLIARGVEAVRQLQSRISRAQAPSPSSTSS